MIIAVIALAAKIIFWSGAIVAILAVYLISKYKKEADIAEKKAKEKVYRVELL